ncbi:MAG: tetratricopeptide repeat protein [Isosphaeraceae bacterium]|nr:tetratricopeptide repeat protein [Isosphaeraceae bacterium]
MRTIWPFCPLLLALVIFDLAAPPVLAQRRLAPAAGKEEAASDSDRDRLIMERFLALLEKSPRRGTALDRVYGYHVERGTLDAFIKTYQDRVAQDPKDGTAWMILGLVESHRGRDAAAVAALRKAEQIRPDDPLPSYYLGQALVLIGQPDEAAQAFERALAHKPPRADLLEIFQALGRIYQRAHHTEKALEVWTRLEKLFPDDQRVQEQIAAALAEESQPEQALPRYQALAQKATDPYRKVQFRIDAAELKVRLGKTAEALADFEALLGQLNPESWLYREVRRKIEEVFLKNDDQAGLAAYYERWIQKTPDDVAAMARLGRTLAAQGRVAEAQAWFDKAVKRAPSRKELRLALVEQLVQERKFAEAAAQYEALAKIEPNNPDYIREWGRLLLKDPAKPEAQRKQEAAAIWRKLIAARPKDAATAVQVADLLRQAELVDEAIALYQKAIELAPDSIQYREYLGEYYHTLKRPSDALATWKQIAAGPNRNAKNLGRLAEVLAGFGYRKEGLTAIAEACALAPDDFELNLKYAMLLHQDERFTEALRQLDVAAPLADSAEQAEAVLEEQIKNYQASNTLGAQAEALKKELDAGQDATAERWRRLARLFEAEQKLPEATAAIQQALALDPKSVPVWAAAARIHESAGNLGAAADAQRKLAELDRRARADYLKEVAKLEARLGRRDEALQAGRELIAASPGNPESYQFFADLCFQLGQTDEGLDALRRAVRVNPSDTKAILALADTLSEQFRTDEAIELFWRAFDKASDLESRLAIVAKLTNLYLQRNQFDRLIGRLELQQREANANQRELSICLAQAYQASGDFGTARQALERLLAANARDTVLLHQLSSLAEAEGDIAAAIKFQKQLNDLAPSDEGKVRLAQLYVRSGEADEAEAIWTSLATGDQEDHRVLQIIDSLIAHSKPETVLALTERLLHKDPNHWEAIYRQAVALAAIEGRSADAETRFRALLDLRVNDDEPSALVKARKTMASTTRPAGASVSSRSRLGQSFPLQDRSMQVWQIRTISGLESRINYGGNFQWSPADFGQARMAALAFLLHLAQRDGRQDELLKELKEARDLSPRDAKPWWDIYYLQLVRHDARQTYEAAKALAQAFPADVGAQWAYLSHLPSRNAPQGRVVVAPSPMGQGEDKTPPLPPADLETMVAAYKTIKQRRPEWFGLQATVLTNIATELKRAKRGEEAEALYRETIDAASSLDAVASALNFAAERGDVDACLALCDKFERLQGNRPSSISFGVLGNPPTSLTKVMNARALAQAYADILKVVDHYMTALRRREARPAPGRQRQALFNSPYGNQTTVAIWFGANQTYEQLDFPRPNEYLDYGAITVLRAAFLHYRRADLMTDLLQHVREQAQAAAGPEAVYPRLALSALFWWNDDKEEAVREFARAVEAVPSDPQLRLDLAELRERQGEREEALATAEAVDPLDNATMQRRETLALRLAVLLGDVERARKAAERLFNLRLDTQLQVQLADQMHQLGMHEMAEAVLARARRRAGNRTGTLVSLMLQYQRQNRMDLAIQVAHQILRKVPTRPFNPSGGITEEDTARNEAINLLARSGRLQELIERAEAQLQASPHSLQLLQMLADYYRAAGDRDKARATVERIVAARPDDAKLRFQIAQQLLQAGDAKGAVEHYRFAIKKEPALFLSRYWEVQNAFQQAGKFDELIAWLEQLDFRPLSNNPASVLNIVQQLLQDDKTRDKGLALFRKAWQALPSLRSNLMGSIYHDAVWNMPEMYDYAREAVIPTTAQAPVAPWHGLETITMYGAEGKVFGVATRLLEIASKQNRLGPLSEEIAQALQALPDWEGGKGLLAAIRARQGKHEEARAAMLALLRAHEKPTERIPLYAAWVLGQEFEDYGPTVEVALALYEGALQDIDDNDSFNRQLNDSPARRLVALYHKAGRPEDARSLVLSFTKRKPLDGRYPPQYAAQQQIQNLNQAAALLFEMGYPADAVRVYTSILSDAEMLQAAQGWRGGDNWLTQQTEQGLARALRGLNSQTLAPTLRALVQPAAEAKPGLPTIDLVMLVHPRSMDQATVTSLLAEAIARASHQPELLAEVRGELAKLADRDPSDFSVPIADALAALAQGKPGEIDQAIATLARRMEERPLEDLSTGARANARQRAEAMRQVGLWLVARACWQREPLKPWGDRFAARALEAAGRQLDPHWTLAMLRERGQVALEAGDRETAEKHWGRMLDEILTNPSLAKGGSGRATATTIALPAPTTVPVTSTPTAPATTAPARGAATKAKGKPAKKEAEKPSGSNEKPAPAPKESKPRAEGPPVQGRFLLGVAERSTLTPALSLGRGGQNQSPPLGAVSYTPLTLPTKCSV